MASKLAENIREFRKQRGLTQEQLAEAMHVTVGAVHKWETQRSAPELDMLMELADFFSVSVDVLLGFQPRDNSLNVTLGRLFHYCQTMDPVAPSEAAKALVRYPNSFRVIYACAEVYLAFGSANHDPDYLRLALEAYEKARLLLAQNDDPHLSDATICWQMAAVHMLLGNYSKTTEILKANNAGGFFSSEIGFCLAVLDSKPEEATHFLSEGLLNGFRFMIYSGFGFVFLYRSRKDRKAMLDVAKECVRLLDSLSTDENSGFMDKIKAEMLLILAYAQKENGLLPEASITRNRAMELAARFDAAPDFSMHNMRFIEETDKTLAMDPFGGTAAAGMDYILRLLDDRSLTEWWKEDASHE